MVEQVLWFKDIGMSDVEVVGGKNASLGEMIANLSNLGVTVPGGFATTSAAYRAFLATDGLDKRISDVLDNLDSSVLWGWKAKGIKARKPPVSSCARRSMSRCSIRSSIDSIWP